MHKFCLYTVARAFNQRIFDNFVLIVHKVLKFIGTVFHFLYFTKSSSKIKKEKNKLKQSKNEKLEQEMCVVESVMLGFWTSILNRQHIYKKDNRWFVFFYFYYFNFNFFKFFKNTNISVSVIKYLVVLDMQSICYVIFCYCVVRLNIIASNAAFLYMYTLLSIHMFFVISGTI